MPDHFHGILYVRERLPKSFPLGKIIGAWKGACSRAYWEEKDAALMRGAANEATLKTKEGSSVSSAAAGISPQSCISREPLFDNGYNDRVLNRKGQLERWIDYLRDNPRRLWLKIHHPDRLKKVYNFKAGVHRHSYTAVGNTFLVTYPESVQVRCHRHLTQEQIQAEVEYYMSLADSGIFLVSPFISPAGKAVYDAAYKAKKPMIRVINQGLDGRFIYPTGRDLKGCTAGFMLVLAPYADYSTATADKRITRSECLDLNSYAADLSTSPLPQ